MATKKYDMAVVTGSYKDRNGNSKNQYETIGAVFNGERGPYAILKKTFNPAGIVSEKDSIIISFFEPKPRQSSGDSSVGESDVPF